MGQKYEYHSPPPRSGGGGAAPMMGAMGGGCAMLIGLILLVAFFLPWQQAGYGGGDQSGYDIATEDLNADNTLGETLYKLVFGSTALAGCGSVIFGLGLAGGALAARRNVAFKSWMATSIGAMVVLASFTPCFMWTFALLGNSIDDLKIGVWISLGAAVFLVVASFIGLVSAFMTQRQQS